METLFTWFAYLKSAGASNVALRRRSAGGWIVAFTFEGESHEACGDTEVKAFEVADEVINGPAEPRCCSICDGMGHGYPGGGPCPLENMGEPMSEREEYLLGLEEDRMREIYGEQPGREW